LLTAEEARILLNGIPVTRNGKAHAVRRTLAGRHQKSALRSMQRATVGDDVFPSAVGNWDNKYDNWHNKWPVSKIVAFIPEWNLGR